MQQSEPATTDERCEECKGSGNITLYGQDYAPYYSIRVRCPTCNGTGRHEATERAEDELEALLSERDALKQEVEQLRSDLQLLNEQVNRNADIAEDAFDRLNTIRDQHDALKHQTDSLCVIKNIAELRLKSLQNKDSRINQLKQELNNLNFSYDLLYNEYHKLKKELEYCRDLLITLTNKPYIYEDKMYNK